MKTDTSIKKKKTTQYSKCNKTLDICCDMKM